MHRDCNYSYLVKDEEVKCYSKCNDKEDIGQDSAAEKYKINNGCKVNGQSSGSFRPHPCFVSGINHPQSRESSNSNLEILPVGVQSHAVLDFEGGL